MAVLLLLIGAIRADRIVSAKVVADITGRIHAVVARGTRDAIGGIAVEVAAGTEVLITPI